MSYEREKVSVPRLARLEKGQKGYGFNLHGDKGKTVQTISAVDKDSAAELGGLRVGDIVIEVNGQNVETLTHMEVVNLIKQKSDETTLLVCDKDTLAYLKEQERPCTADMANLTTVIPPEKPEEVANGSATIEEVQEKSVESEPTVVEDTTPTPPDPVTKVEDHEPAPASDNTTPEEVQELNNVLDEQEKPAEQPEPPAVQQVEEPPKPTEPVEPPKPEKTEDKSDGLSFDMEAARRKASGSRRRQVKTDGSSWSNKVNSINAL